MADVDCVRDREYSPLCMERRKKKKKRSGARWTDDFQMLGFIASVAFQNVITPLESVDPQYPQWRWMLGSTAIPPMFVMAQVYLCPESPRWHMERGHFAKAFRSFMRLRNTPVQASRDMYYAYKLLEVERAAREGKNLWKEFFLKKRNQRAAQSSFFVMFMQQFCGVNVIGESPPTICRMPS
jgi:hypothetical protein